jgi:hypothetical protein
LASHRRHAARPSGTLLLDGRGGASIAIELRVEGASSVPCRLRFEGAVVPDRCGPWRFRGSLDTDGRRRPAVLHARYHGVFRSAGRATAVVWLAVERIEALGGGRGTARPRALPFTLTGQLNPERHADGDPQPVVPAPTAHRGARP